MNDAIRCQIYAIGDYARRDDLEEAQIREILSEVRTLEAQVLNVLREHEEYRQLIEELHADAAEQERRSLSQRPWPGGPVRSRRMRDTADGEVR